MVCSYLDASELDQLCLLNRNILIKLGEFLLSGIAPHSRGVPKIEVKFEIDSETLSVQVPNLLLQPIVENAFKHGVAVNLETTLIQISAFLKQDKLHIHVFNSNSSLPEDWKITGYSEGIGLTNTGNRLRQLYKGRSKFEISEENDGVLVAFVLPKRLT